MPQVLLASARFLLAKMTHILLLPVELYHYIVHFLDVKDVFALRRTCRCFFALTQERSVWLVLFTRLRATQPLPCSRTEFVAMSSPEAERVLVAACKVEALFLEERECLAQHVTAVKQPYSSTNGSSCSLRVLTFISDRFILSVDWTAVVIWDATTLALSSSSAVATSSPWAYFSLSNVVGYVDCHSALYIAVAEHHSAVIYSVSLEHDPPPLLHREAEFPLLENEILKHMDPETGRALLYSPPSTIHIVHWLDANNKRSAMSLQPDQLDQVWNGVTCLRFCGPYVLCFRVRAIEAYPVSDPLPVLRHRFGPVAFRAVSLSRVRVSPGNVYTLYMLTNDVYKGMFHYRIRIATVPVPAMSVHILAKGTLRPSHPLPLVPGTEVRYTLDDVVRRMFVSTWSLGSAGLRGVWVDRQRGSIDRRVVAFTTHPRRLAGEDPLEHDDEPPMDGKAVHLISSYDLRDDITICAVSEWTGRIALGSRIGAISLL